MRRSTVLTLSLQLAFPVLPYQDEGKSFMTLPPGQRCPAHHDEGREPQVVGVAGHRRRRRRDEDRQPPSHQTGGLPHSRIGSFQPIWVGTSVALRPSA